MSCTAPVHRTAPHCVASTVLHLAERCLPYVRGERHPATRADRGELNRMARVAE